MNTSRPVMKRAIELYFDAWAKQTPILLQEVFTHDAIYRVKPFGQEEYHGLEAILRYWKSNPCSKQIGPQPRVISKAFGHDIAFVEWQTLFGVSGGGSVTLRGMLVLVFRCGKVCELREHYSAGPATSLHSADQGEKSASCGET